MLSPGRLSVESTAMSHRRPITSTANRLRAAMFNLPNQLTFAAADAVGGAVLLHRCGSII